MTQNSCKSSLPNTVFTIPMSCQRLCDITRLYWSSIFSSLTDPFCKTRDCHRIVVDYGQEPRQRVIDKSDFVTDLLYDWSCDINIDLFRKDHGSTVHLLHPCCESSEVQVQRAGTETLNRDERLSRAPRALH